MINTLKPSDTLGHDDKKGEILEKISREYGKPEEKQREAVKKLGKDEFFKIMVTQIQHQDPLKPYQNEQMAAQMAQFTALEQMMNVNSNLEKLTNAQQPLQNLGAANLIGKFVTSDSSRLIHTEGKFSDISFELPIDAPKVHISIMNDRGEIVRELEMKDVKKGTAKLEWDGKNTSNFSAKSGMYSVVINAKSALEKPIQVQTTKTEVVHGVGFEGKETVLLTGDVRKPNRMLLKHVAKIVDPAQKKAAEAGSATPFVQGLPPGMQIGGLENLMGGAGADEGSIAAGSPGGEDTNAQLAAEIDAADRNVPGLEIGQQSKFAPVDAKEFRKGEEKPVIQPGLSNDQIRKMMSEAQDLSAANPVAEAMREGKAYANPGAGVSNKDVPTVNPAAAARGYAANSNGARLAPGQSVQSGEDGSVSGKLAE